MTITFNIWVLLFGGGLVIGLFLQFLFIFFRKTRSIHFRNVIAVLFIMSLMILDEILQESDLIDTFPFFAEITLTLDLLIWPFFLFYIQSISGKRNEYKFSDFIYFLPFLIGFTWQIPYTFASGLEKLKYFDNGIPANLAAFVFFKALVAFVFLGSMIWMLTKRKRALDKLFSGNKKVQLLTDFRKLVTVVSALVVLVYLIFFLNFLDFRSLGNSDKIGSLLIISTFYFIGITAYKNPTLFEENSYSSLIVNYFNGKESEHTDRLFELFEKEKPYLKEKLSIGETAHKLGLTNQQLSYLINQHLGITFLDFVNSYRVRAMKLAIENGEHETKTLLGLALESGFGNKATFNRIFKSHEGVSPSSFARRVTKEVSNPN